MAVPALNGQDVEQKSQTCLDLVRKPVAQPPAKAGLEASLEILPPQGAGRPCYEADDSACRGEWRREDGSPREGARPMPSREREIGELPSPISSPFGRKTGRGHLFSIRAIKNLPLPGV